MCIHHTNQRIFLLQSDARITTHIFDKKTRILNGINVKFIKNKAIHKMKNSENDILSFKIKISTTYIPNQQTVFCFQTMIH